MIKRKKPKLALWTNTFPEQHSKLFPERDIERGGANARSQSEKLRLDIYRPIADLFKQAHPYCEAKIHGSCSKSFEPNRTDDVHHKRGRRGLLLFDIRHWLAVCRFCHNWIRDNPLQAKQLGLDESHKKDL